MNRNLTVVRWPSVKMENNHSERMRTIREKSATPWPNSPQCRPSADLSIITTGHPASQWVLRERKQTKILSDRAAPLPLELYWLIRGAKCTGDWCFALTLNDQHYVCNLSWIVLKNILFKVHMTLVWVYVPLRDGSLKLAAPRHLVNGRTNDFTHCASAVSTIPPPQPNP